MNSPFKAWALTMLGALLVSGCGGSASNARGPFYDRSVLKQQLDTREVKALRAELPARLGKTRLVREDPTGARSPVDPATLPEAAAVALYFVLRTGDPAAVEFDLMVETTKDQRVPVTVRREKGSFVLRGGERPVGFPRGRGEDLVGRHGIGPLKEEGVAWSPRAQEVTDLALSRLSADERKVLANVPFIRRKKDVAEHVPGGAAGLYAQDGCKARVLIFDAALHADAWKFIGEPEAPLQASIKTLLHEFGHAIHSRPGRMLLCDLERREHTLQGQINAFNRRPEAQRRGPEAARAAQAIKAEVAALERDAKRARHFVERGPVIDAYLRALGKGSPPTRYGATAPSESFAESFALYRADPAALQRLLPAVFAFFERGEHLKVLTTAPK